MAAPCRLAAWCSAVHADHRWREWRREWRVALVCGRGGRARRLVAGVTSADWGRCSQAWPSTIRGVYGDADRYEATYFSAYKGYYFSGDGARRDGAPPLPTAPALSCHCLPWLGFPSSRARSSPVSTVPVSPFLSQLSSLCPARQPRACGARL